MTACHVPPNHMDGLKCFSAEAIRLIVRQKRVEDERKVEVFRIRWGLPIMSGRVPSRTQFFRFFKASAGVGIQ